jgi:photosystem II stability/assembly factor-like uncharacterized protein
VNANVVWASGTGGTVIRTLDGGKNWTAIVVPGAETLDFRGIRAFDDKTAVIISSGPAEKGQAHIYRTSDGGKNWQQVYEEKRAGIFFDAVAFWDRKHGIVLSDPVDGKFVLFTTDDGGATWKQIPPVAFPQALKNEGAFAASNSCLTVQGQSSVWFATGGASVARVFRSSDRGKSWQVAETPIHPANASSGIFSLAFKDAKNGIAVGGDYQKPEGSDLPNVMRTSDGGKTWEVDMPTNPGGLYISSVVNMPLKDGFVIAGIKGMFHSVGEYSWIRNGEEALNSVAATMRGASVVDIWAVGPKGTTIRTEIRYVAPPRMSQPR